jgi:hypothetical protein
MNFHRCLVNLDVDHRLQEDAFASCFVQKWRACEDDAYVHAKCNDKDVPQNSRSQQNGSRRTAL